MLQSILNSSTTPLLQKLAEFGERRQEFLAENIANFDTPNYKPRDLPVADFNEALKAALDSRINPQSPGSRISAAVSHQKTIEDLFPDELFRPSETPAKNITFQDGNNRSVEHTIMEMTKNSMMQQLAVELMTAQFNLLQAAISERP